jgi:hypothetical protein
MRFKYGSIGAEHDAGIPYWIFYVLPRVFPEKFRQDGKVLPAATPPWAWPGSRARNCRPASPKRPSAFPASPTTAPPATPPATGAAPDANPVFVSGGPGHTTNIENFFRLLIDCARDPRFNADILMAEINRVTDLDVIDQLLYRFLIIPITRSACSNGRPSLPGSTALTFRNGGAAATTA